MADTDPQPAQPNWLARNAKTLLTILAVASWLVTAIVALQRGQPIPPPPVIVERSEPDKPFIAGHDGKTYPAFGWNRDPEQIDENLNVLVTEQFDDTPAGKAKLGDEDVFLWRAVRKVSNRGPPWYPNINQGPVGACVGAGTKHTIDVSQAMQIVNGVRAEWKALCAEVIYGGSRVEIGGGRIRGDGSVGAWAAKFVQQFGVVPMEKIGAYDLTAFSPARARQFGSTGVPAELEAVAKEHPVKSTALVKSWADVKKAIQQGYPVAVCSDQGFSMTRDATGLARPMGTWAHCMSIIAVATVNGKERAFVLNSWGDEAHTGGVWPEDMPVSGFWADAAVIDRMVRQGDSFAYSDMTGFPSRRVPIDWVVQAQDARPLFALAW